MSRIDELRAAGMRRMLDHVPRWTLAPADDVRPANKAFACAVYSALMTGKRRAFKDEQEAEPCSD